MQDVRGVVNNRYNSITIVSQDTSTFVTTSKANLTEESKCHTFFHMLSSITYRHYLTDVKKKQYAF